MKNAWKICIVFAIVVVVVASVAVVVYVNRDVKNIIYYSSAELNDTFDLDCQVCAQGLWTDLTWRVQYNNRATWVTVFPQCIGKLNTCTQLRLSRS